MKIRLPYKCLSVTGIAFYCPLAIFLLQTYYIIYVIIIRLCADGGQYLQTISTSRKPSCGVQRKWLTGILYCPDGRLTTTSRPSSGVSQPGSSPFASCSSPSALIFKGANGSRGRLKTSARRCRFMTRLVALPLLRTPFQELLQGCPAGFPDFTPAHCRYRIFLPDLHALQKRG